MEIKFKVETKPVSVNAMYPTNRQGRRFLSQEGGTYKSSIGWAAKQAYQGDVIHQDITATLKFGFKDKRKRDVDNYVKSTLDALTGIIYKDDSQICQFTASKEYAIIDFVEITITSAD